MKNLRPFLETLLGISILLLCVLALGAELLSIFRSFPLQTLIAVGLVAICGLAIVLYIWELVIIGWVMDFLTKIGMPKIRAVPAPLEYEQVGEITVVKLRDNIATVLDCQAVQKELNRLIEEGHCDFVLDFAHAGKISRHFRRVMVHVMKAARKEAVKLGKPYRPVALPHGQMFRVFDNRRRAVAEMSKHDGHGWVVLCSVPFGIRAVSEQT